MTTIGDRIASKYTILEPLEMAALAIEIDEAVLRENERLKEDVDMFARIAEDWQNWCFKKGFEGLPTQNSE